MHVPLIQYGCFILSYCHHINGLGKGKLESSLTCRSSYNSLTPTHNAHAHFQYRFLKVHYYRYKLQLLCNTYTGILHVNLKPINEDLLQFHETEALDILQAVAANQYRCFKVSFISWRDVARELM